jgi:hypothetical protein
MSYTLGGLVSRVQNRVRDTSFAYAQIQQYLNDTLNDIVNTYRLPTALTNQVYVLTVDDSDITSGDGLPDDFSQVLDLTLTTSGYEKVIPFLSVNDIDRQYPDPDDGTVNPSGSPLYAYFTGNTLRVYPEPDVAYTVRLRYYTKATELVADGDEPFLPSEFSEALVLGAAYRVMQVKDNYDQAAILENKYNELVQQLVVKQSQRHVGTSARMRINRRVVGSKNF